jgi:hypothetical protein
MKPPAEGEIIIPSRFRGPATSGNGGYTCGLVAGLVEGDAEVTLRAPPPLDRPLRVDRSDGSVAVYDGDTLIAQAGRCEWEIEIPDPPTLEEATAASARYAGFERHAFPECFVCGTARPDGLAVFAGPVEGRDLVASPWTPDGSLPAEAGELAPEMVWASLDCPGAWAEERHLESEPVVLGRMAARIMSAVRVGEQYITVGWPIGRDGRKLFAGTALFSADGTVCGCARQTWIVLGR